MNDPAITKTINKDGVRYDSNIFSEEEVDDLLEHVRKRAVCPEDLRRQGDSLVRKASRIQVEHGPKPYVLPEGHPAARRRIKKELST